MQIGRILGATRVLGREQGYVPLPIRDAIAVTPGNQDVHEMVSAWLPTADELAKLNAGAPVHLHVLGGCCHPPVKVEVGEAPNDRPAPAVHSSSLDHTRVICLGGHGCEFEYQCFEPACTKLRHGKRDEQS